MIKTTTTIYTGLYGKTAAKTLNLLFRDWRNSYGWYNNLLTIKEQGYGYTARNSEVSISDDGSVCIEVPNYALNMPYHEDVITASAYKHGTDIAYIKHWLANALRDNLHFHVFTDDNDRIRLNRKSKTSPTSHVWEIKATADALDGKDIKTIYGAKVFDKVVGKAADPVRTEVNAVIEEESRRICNEFKNKQRDMHDVLNQKICALRKQYRKDIADLDKQCRKAISNMKKELMAA